MTVIHRIIRVGNAISDYTGKAVAWLTTALVIVVCYDVFIRYCLGRFGNYLRKAAEDTK